MRGADLDIWRVEHQCSAEHLARLLGTTVHEVKRLIATDEELPEKISKRFEALIYFLEFGVRVRKAQTGQPLP